MTPPDGLYEKDFYAWTQAQARELRAAAADPRTGWEESAIEARVALDDTLSASLRRDLEDSYPRLYSDAKERAEVGLRRHGEAAALPDECPYTLDQVLTRGWYPPSRHGLT
jgi:hypothetical protein